ncbi:HEAT repeat domain-containing protein [Planctomycetota bacterium]|nr:HEAT repeat domain-containing protein [Planctomycetota bacterium]
MRWTLLIALLCCATPALADGEPQAGPQSAAIDALRRALDGEPGQPRIEALSGLAQLGPEGREALREALRHSDPDVRFHALFLLQEPDVEIERLVRTIAVGQPGAPTVDAASYPAAREAMDQIVEAGTGDAERAGNARATLIRIARRNAGRDGAAPLYVAVSLDLVSMLLAQTEPTSEDAARLAELLSVDLGTGFYELCNAFAMIPVQVMLPVLRGVISGGTPPAQARAARVLSEVLPRSHAAEAAQAIVPLLEHRLSRVRADALHALSTLPLEGEALIPAGRLANDPDPTVAALALQIAAENGLGFARESAERIAAEPTSPPNLRRQAVRTLGQLGEAGSGPVLTALAEDTNVNHELRAQAAWALGACRAPNARRVIHTLLQDPWMLRQAALYHGLARTGRAGQADLEAMAAVRTPWQPENVPADRLASQRRAPAIQALGSAELSLQAAAALRSVLEPGTARTRRFTSKEEHRLAIQALVDLGDESARYTLGTLIAEGALDTVLDLALPALAWIGTPAGDEDLNERLSTALVRIMNRSRGFMGNTQRLDAARALAKINPERAKAVLRATLEASRGQAETSRSLARVLATVGDRTFVDSHALPVSRDKVENPPMERIDLRSELMNDVGIDLLYAARLNEAVSEFKRMLWCDTRYDIASYNVACGYSLAGDVDNALRYLRRSIHHGYVNARHLEHDPDLSPLQNDPRFKRLLRRLYQKQEMGLVIPARTWGNFGDWNDPENPERDR